MKIAIIGTGFVGLTTGACLAQFNSVTCVDSNIDRIKKLKKGILPFYEPGLPEIVQEGLFSGNLKFITKIKKAIQQNDCIIICVGTPPRDNGEADLSALHEVCTSINRFATNSKKVVIKSTVPVGTNDRLAGRMPEHSVISNPEFLREGQAVYDFLKPDRIVAGVRTLEDDAFMYKLYKRYLKKNIDFLSMPPREAELTKYAANAFLATKISFINEIASLCEEYEVNIDYVRNAIGMDKRIGHQFLNPGVGYGGACFPKDLDALIHMFLKVHRPCEILDAVRYRNSLQKMWPCEILRQEFSSLEDLNIAVWGVAFKPNTDDTRNAPAIDLLNYLWPRVEGVTAYDPEVDICSLFNGIVQQSVDPYEAAQGCDALIIMTDWQEFKDVDLVKLLGSMTKPLIIDGRNIYDPSKMKDLGFKYYSVGRVCD